ncbi:MAG TPA: HAMP domain-containing sensor histidine kinase [Nitrospirota bacterium]
MFKNLYARLAAVLLGLFLAIGVLYALLTIYTTRLYFQEVNQKLNRILAQHLVSEKVLLQDGRVNEEALKNIFHMLMVVNPSIEVYLLGPDGKILAFSAPPGKVKRQSVSLEPIKRLLSNSSPLPVLGDDPRDPAGRKVFSVSPIMLAGRAEGYLYIILGGEAFETEAQMLQGSYILRLSMWAAIGGLLFALLTALLLFDRLTRPLRQLTAAMETFRQRGFSEPPEFLSRVQASSGNEIGRLGMIFKQMADRIAFQIKELKAADAHRREFLANVTHDLRTPLTSLQGYIETLIMKEGTLTPEEQRNYLSIALKRSEQLRNLVSELFELAKLDSPNVQVHFEPFSLSELIQDILQKFQLTVEKKKIVLQMNAAEDLPRVNADIGLLERVFENLIDNAVRYTPENGSITVSAGPEKERVVVRVSDTGSGIAQDAIPHLFDIQHRRYRTRQDSNVGSGLGLAIVGRILELHGSTIDVSSAINAGTTFTFTLPIYKPQS